MKPYPDGEQAAEQAVERDYLVHVTRLFGAEVPVKAADPDHAREVAASCAGAWRTLAWAPVDGDEPVILEAAPAGVPA